MVYSLTSMEITIVVDNISDIESSTCINIYVTSIRHHNTTDYIFVSYTDIMLIARV